MYLHNTEYYSEFFCEKVTNPLPKLTMLCVVLNTVAKRELSLKEAPVLSISCKYKDARYDPAKYPRLLKNLVRTIKRF